MVFPKPARDIVRFTYDLSYPSDVTITIFDRNARLINDITDPGKFEFPEADTVVHLAAVVGDQA